MIKNTLQLEMDIRRAVKQMGAQDVYHPELGQVIKGGKPTAALIGFFKKLQAERDTASDNAAHSISSPENGQDHTKDKQRENEVDPVIEDKKDDGNTADAQNENSQSIEKHN